MHCPGEAVVSGGMQMCFWEEKKEFKHMKLIVNPMDACTLSTIRETSYLTPYFSYKFAHEVPEKGNNNLK